MRIIYLVLFTLLTAVSLHSGTPVFVVAKGGISSYGALYFGPLGGGDGGDWDWHTGPYMSVGVRIRPTEGFAADALVEYSTHRYDGQYHTVNAYSNSWNSVLDFTANLRLSLRLFDPVHIVFIGGGGLTFRHADEIVGTSWGSRYFKPATSDSRTVLVLGLGLEGRFAKTWEFSVEGGIRGREYATPVAQFGLAYSFW